MAWWVTPVQRTSLRHLHKPAQRPHLIQLMVFSSDCVQTSIYSITAILLEHTLEWFLNHGYAENFSIFFLSFGLTINWVEAKKRFNNTPETRGGPGGRDRLLAVKSRKDGKKSAFFSKKKKNYQKNLFCIYLLVIPKYWGKQIFTHGRFPEVGQKQKTERKREKSESG